MKRSVEFLPKVSPERLRDELFQNLEVPQASAAISAIELVGALPYILPELPALKLVDQSTPHVYDVWAHTIAVMKALHEVLSALAPGYDPESAGDIFTGLLVIRLGRYRDRIQSHLNSTLTKYRSLRALLYFAALYHDVAKPHCKRIDEEGSIRFFGHEESGSEIAAARARALRLSNDEIERLEKIIGSHMRLRALSQQLEQVGHQPSRRAVYRFFRDNGEAGVDLVLLALADVRATYGHTLTQETWSATLDVCRQFLEHYWEKPQEAVSPPVLLDGHEIMSGLKLDPGPIVGSILEAIREAQATGMISTREEAMQFGRDWLEQN